MEEGRICGVGRASSACSGALARWARLAGEARAAAARAGAGPPGGATRERSKLLRALSRTRFQRCISDETTVNSILCIVISLELSTAELYFFQNR